MERRRMIVWTVLCLAGVTIAGTIAAYAAMIPKDATYVGTDKCRMCHLKENKTWKASKHSSNFEDLQADERKNPDCLKCHTTGYGLPGGFVSEEQTPGLKNVGCESCHGPGSAHVQAAKAAGASEEWEKKINKVPQNTCIQCHNPHISQKARVEKMRAAAGL